MDARVNFNDAADAYELGVDVEGVFVPFVTVPGPQVRATVDNVHEVNPPTPVTETSTGAQAITPAEGTAGQQPPPAGEPNA